MSRILCIETSTHSCSVAIGEDNAIIDSRIITGESYLHAEKLHPLLSQLTSLSSEKPGAIAVSMGPGSYTGLRIGVAAAKGLCLAWNIPLISIDTLQLIAIRAEQMLPGMDLYIPMIDARRMEVYMRVFDKNSGGVSPVEARIVDHHFFELFGSASMAIAGDGAAKFVDFLLPGQHFIPGVIPLAEVMLPLALEKFALGETEDLASFEPYYLKDFIPGPAKT